MILTILGARPQFVKASVVSKAFLEIGLEEVVVHTGQHYDSLMSNIFWKELNLPDIYSNLEVGSGSHGTQTARIIQEIESLLGKLKPAALVVYGDTNSTLGAAIAASKFTNLKIVHIEAGLRSFNREMPEEINRILTDHVSHFLFCSSEKGTKQLEKEGITRNVFDVGDVMHDCLRTYLPMQKEIEEIKDITRAPFALMTIHRPSNTDNAVNIDEIFAGISKIDMPVLWPMHPRNKKFLSEWSIPSNLIILDPASYFEMLYLLNHCEVVITDSGGLQKEAYWMKKPCITIRNETEWVETLSDNANVLTGPDGIKIYNAYKERNKAKWIDSLYGDGSAAKKVAEILKARL